MELDDMELEAIAGGKGQRKAASAVGAAATRSPRPRMFGMGLSPHAGQRSVGMFAGISRGGAAASAAGSNKSSPGVGGDCPGGICR